jgi:hypothetical protein
LKNPDWEKHGRFFSSFLGEGYGIGKEKRG